MRKIRVLSVIIFVLSVGAFVYFKILANHQVDTHGPEISMTENSIQVSVAASSEEILAGVTAIDAKDGDVSDSLVIESMTNFAERGRRTVTFAACDKDNNVTKGTREIIYSDYTPPSFALSAPFYFPQNAGTLADGLTASDVLDGDLTSNIKMYVEERVQVDTPGDYPVVFSVSNSAGDTVQLPVTITIYDPSKTHALPSIALSEYLIHIQKGQSIDPWSYVDEVTYQGTTYKPEIGSEGGPILVEDYDGEDGSFGERDYLTNIEIVDPVDVNTAGTYEITYQVTASEGNEQYTGTMRLIVVVDE